MRHDRSINKKKILLELAKSGAEKPPKKTLLGMALRNYLRKGYASYDADFHNELLSIRADWFDHLWYIKKLKAKTKPKQKSKRFFRITSAKVALLKMAENGEEKPKLGIYNDGICLGRMLYGYTNIKSNSYDAEFVEKIKQLNPKWLRCR